MKIKMASVVIGIVLSSLLLSSGCSHHRHSRYERTNPVKDCPATWNTHNPYKDEYHRSDYHKQWRQQHYKWTSDRPR